MDDMKKDKVRTVTIPIDEYFGLRQKAEINAMLIENLGVFEGRLMDIDRRLWDVEQAVKGNG